MPFNPLRVTEPAIDQDQRVYPAVDGAGEPLWQQGDTHVAAWDAVGLGWCQGAIGNRREHTAIASRVYLTDARLVVVSGHYAQGTKYGAFFGGTVISSAVRSRVAHARAEREAKGTFLVGQMRHPWISQVVYSRATRRKDEHVVRVCGAHTTAFGDQEVVMLLIKFDSRTDPGTVASEIANRVMVDRLTWDTTTDDERRALQAARFADPAELPEGTLPSIRLAGSYIVSTTSGAQGVFSSRSTEGAQVGGRGAVEAPANSAGRHD